MTPERWWTRSAAVLAFAIVLIALAYGNALHGVFVHDDTKQIAANPLVRDPALFKKALLSDVWAYKGDEEHAASNYWRPMFVAWLSLNHAMFGLAPRGWHVTNILLHIVATMLVFRALRLCGVRAAACAFATWIFAVHPVHVESVTWISGSPDLLLAGFLLGAFVVHLAARSRPGWALPIVAIALHAGAVLSKEIGVVFPVIIAITEWVFDAAERRPWRASLARALRAAAPYLLVSIVFMLFRIAVLGTHRLEIPGAVGMSEVVLSAPSVLLFYLKQIFLPMRLGPTYGLEAVTPSTVGLLNFFVPAAVALSLVWFATIAVRRHPRIAIGLAWFVLPLAPALDLRSFSPEDLVHDRYLYLALAGILGIVGETWVSGWRLQSKSSDSTPTQNRSRRERQSGGMSDTVGELAPAWIGAVVIAVALVPVTRSYNRVWHDEIALWERGTQTNPARSYPYSQLGGPYRQAGRLKEARAMLMRAIELNPGSKTANLSLGALEVREGRYQDAEKHLGDVLRTFPDDRVATEQLALAYQKQGKLDDALRLFENARRDRPRLRAIYGVNIAVLHRMAGRADKALAELESLRPELERASDHGAARGLWYLGELYREQGRVKDAAAAYTSYLTVTASMRDPDAEALRPVVKERLAHLAG